MKQELLLYPKFPHTEAAVVKVVRIAIGALVAVYWLNEIFSPGRRHRS